MSSEKVTARTCEQCGHMRIYSREESIQYRTKYGTKSFSAPMYGMIVLSMQDGDKRKFLDFCSSKCVAEYFAKVVTQS